MTPFEKAVEAMFHAENGIDGDSVGDMVFEDFRISGTAEEAIKTSKAVLARALTAALSALESEGWVLVPLEPTEAMIYQGHHEIDWNRNGQNTSVPRHGSQKEPIDGELVGTFCEDDIRDSYRAMLASRPAPTAPASED